MPKRTAPTEDPELLPIMDADDWEVVPEAEAVKVGPRLGATITVRFDHEAAHLIACAARREGITRSEFLRRSAVQAASTLAEQERGAR